MSVFAVAAAAPRPVTTPRLSVAGQQRGREERLLHANYRPMQQLAVARRARWGRAVLCIVIRESPLSPFLPIFKCRDLQLDFLLSFVAHRPPSRLPRSSIFPLSAKPLRSE